MQIKTTLTVTETVPRMISSKIKNEDLLNAMVRVAGEHQIPVLRLSTDESEALGYNLQEQIVLVANESLAEDVQRMIAGMAQAFYMRETQLNRFTDTDAFNIDQIALYAFRREPAEIDGESMLIILDGFESFSFSQYALTAVHTTAEEVHKHLLRE